MDFKNYLKKTVRKYKLDELRDIQTEHIKIKLIQFNSLKSPQEYLGDKQFNNWLSSLLFNLRSQSVNGVRGNFSNLFEDNTQCQFNCFDKEDSQEHLLECHELEKHLDQRHKSLLSEVVYSDLFGSTTKQLKITRMFWILLRVRERLLGKNQQPACHANSSGPSG